jgi:hypothetical protein
MIERYLKDYITPDLKEKMVFISGPRQVGKTTLAKQIGDQYYQSRHTYFNWDNRQDRQTILSGLMPADKQLLIFDEIHKYRNWKVFLKGEYDKNKERFNILVTGSARLDLYKKGGDSLLGRYRGYRLHPLSFNELCARLPEVQPHKELRFAQTANHQKDTLETLLKFGGFPEIFIKQSERDLRRWQNERVDRLIREDIRDIENIREISSLQVLVELLPEKVGSLFSLNSLKEDLGVTHKTISSWVDIIERFYYHFRIYPYQSTLIKSLRKEPKLYLWDWSEVKDEDSRFENLIAGHLLKFCHFLHDSQGYKARLFFIRDQEHREVDFLVAIDNKPWFCVETKRAHRDIPASLSYFQTKLKIPFCYLVVREPGIDRLKDKIRIISAHKFLSGLV